MEVYDQMGRRVTAIRITSSDMQLDVSGWSGGVYFIRVNGTHLSRAGKLLKL